MCNSNNLETVTFRPARVFPIEHLQGMSERSVRNVADWTRHGEVETTTLLVDSSTGVGVATVKNAGLEAKISLVGTFELPVIGSVEVDAEVDLKLENSVLTLTFLSRKPIALGPYTFTFNIPSGRGDGTVTLTSLEANGDVISCLLKCLGTSIRPILIKCLPSLPQGPQAFLACVVAALPAALPALVICGISCVTS